MEIPKNILKELKKTIRVDGITKTATGCCVNYRTLQRLVTLRICKDEFLLKIKAYLNKRAEQIQKMA